MLTARDDLYPSRFGSEPKWLPRLEPTIHGKPEDVLAAGLSQQQMDDYEQQGFLVLEEIFTPDEVQTLQNQAESLRTDPRMCSSEQAITEIDGRAVRSMFQIHTLPFWQRVICDERLAGLAMALLGDQVYLHQSRLNFKPAFWGQPFFWHSDFETWHTEDGMPRMRALSMSLTLTPNHGQNGPLMLIPGSHQHHITCVGQTPPDHFKQSLKQQDIGTPSPQVMQTLVERYGLFTVQAQPGSVIVFDCNTLHGSNGNISPWPRNNAFFVFNAMSNAVQAPYATQTPRPEYIATRDQVSALTPCPKHTPGLTQAK